jgi:hypothetical protein
MSQDNVKKKTVNRNIAIALGVTCVILVGLLAFSVYQGLSDSAQITNLSNIVSLRASSVWANSYNVTQPSLRYSSSSSPAYSLLTYNASYAGYITVNVQSSSKPNIYVQVLYTTTYGINYDSTVSFNGVTLPSQAVFPVVPASIQIRVGNSVSGSNAPQTVTEIVTVTYYY